MFDQLLWAELITVADGDPLWELRRLSLTDTGKARYGVLCEQRETDPGVPPPEFGTTQTTTQTPVGRRSEPRPPAPGDRSGPTP